VNSERSEEVSGNTDCATSPGFIVEVLRANMWQTEMSAENRALYLPGSKQDPAASLTAYRRRPDISRHNPAVHHRGRLKIPRNLTKLGHRTGHFRP